MHANWCENFWNDNQISHESYEEVHMGAAANNEDTCRKVMIAAVTPYM
jgi:hypothetical protein